MVGLTVERRVLSVDWDARELRVVHARLRRETVHIEDVFAVTIPPEVSLANADELGLLLRRALDQERIDCRRVIVDIPRDQAVLQTLSLPAASISDLAGMVRVQIVKGLPFPVSEAVVDFAVPPEEEQLEETRDVLVGAVRSEVVQFYQDVCHKAGLRLERVGLRPYANRVAVNAFFSGAPPQRVLVVDVGPALTEIDVLRGGQLVFSRAASVYVPTDAAGGGLSPADAAEDGTALDSDDEAPAGPFRFDAAPAPRDLTAVVADLMVEVTRSIEAYRGTDPGAEMNCAVVAGGTGIEETLAEAIQRRFGIGTEVYNPASCLDGDAERGAVAGGFAAALGLMLGHAGEGRLHFNFLDPKKQEQPGQAQLRKVPLIAAVVALFVIAGVTFYVRGPAEQFARIERLEEQIQDTKAEIKSNKKFIELVGTAEEFEADQVVWIDELNRLVALLPDSKKVVLDRLDMFQRDRRIQMEMLASDKDQHSEFVEKLQDYRLEDIKGPYYKVSRGGMREASGSGSKYKYEDKLTIELRGGEEKSGKKSRRRR